MITTIVITALTCIALILIILTSPVLRIGRYRLRILYWFAPLLGALLLLATGRILPQQIWEGLTGAGAINPLKILVLFISMTELSIFLDEAGMFAYLAGALVNKFGHNQKKLFLTLYLTVSILTVFTSNDIIILTFTPFICYFAKNAGIDPMPYLFGEFVAANTFSMVLIIGNPTNIYLAGSAGISFFDYTAVMLVPTLLAGVVAFGILWLLFRKQLRMPMTPTPSHAKIESRALVLIGVLHLGICTILLVLSSYLGFEMWLITLLFALSLFLCVLVHQRLRRRKTNILLHTLVRAPWELIPFVLSMFVIVLSLHTCGVTGNIAAFLGEDCAVLKYGVASFFSANLINNIPMAVLFSAITENLSGAGMAPALYASVIGSNLGAYLTPIGALAGIMWSGILGKMGLSFSFRKFASLGFRVAIPTLLAALGGLMLVMQCL